MGIPSMFFFRSHPLERAFCQARRGAVSPKQGPETKRTRRFRTGLDVLLTMREGVTTREPHSRSRIHLQFRPPNVKVQDRLGTCPRRPATLATAFFTAAYPRPRGRPVTAALCDLRARRGRGSRPRDGALLLEHRSRRCALHTPPIRRNNGQEWCSRRDRAGVRAQLAQGAGFPLHLARHGAAHACPRTPAKRGAAAPAARLCRCRPEIRLLAASLCCRARPSTMEQASSDGLSGDPAAAHGRPGP